MNPFRGDVQEWHVHQHPIVVAAGIRRVISQRYGSMLWTPSKLRKAHVCGLCRRSLPVGGIGWRPITFGDWRMIRICTVCWTP